MQFDSRDSQRQPDEQPENRQNGQSDGFLVDLERLERVLEANSLRRRALPNRPAIELKCDPLLRERLEVLPPGGSVEALILFDIKVGRGSAWLMSASERASREEKIAERLGRICADLSQKIEPTGMCLERDPELDPLCYVRVKGVTLERLHLLVERENVVGVLRGAA